MFKITENTTEVTGNCVGSYTYTDIYENRGVWVRDSFTERVFEDEEGLHTFKYRQTTYTQGVGYGTEILRVPFPDPRGFKDLESGFTRCRSHTITISINKDEIAYYR